MQWQDTNPCASLKKWTTAQKDISDLMTSPKTKPELHKHVPGVGPAGTEGVNANFLKDFGLARRNNCRGWMPLRVE